MIAEGAALRKSSCQIASTVWDETFWRQKQAEHEVRVDTWITPRLARRSSGKKHPVYDFLFEYYSYRPSCLRRWHPGVGVLLTGDGVDEFEERAGYARDMDGGVYADPGAWKPERRRFVEWLVTLLEATAERPGWFGCAGLHEWAMVYQAGPQRHLDWPLRLSQQETDEVVQSQPVRCSHFDAFRFFTPPAVLLNRLQPQRATTVENEQQGCLHANMDLYKWAYKLAPFTSSELVADAFALAKEIREVDMRASPYDFSSIGFAPIRIETSSGREEFEQYQRQFAAQAAPLREAILCTARKLLGIWRNGTD